MACALEPPEEAQPGSQSDFSTSVSRTGEKELVSLKRWSLWQFVTAGKAN